MKRKSKRILILFTLVLFFAILMVPVNNEIDNYKDSEVQIKKSNNPKNAGYWEVNRIHITGANWTQTNSTYKWCSGKGTKSEPYVIEDVIIDGKGGAYSGILIENSLNTYFEIKNCTIYDCGKLEDFYSSDIYAGIILNNTKYGKIIDNNCSSSSNGMFLENCSNTLISGNFVNINGRKNAFYASGIILKSSDNNTIFNNTANYNYSDGISLSLSEYNNISCNIANYNDNGISIGNCNKTSVSNNIVKFNTDNGIRIFASQITMDDIYCLYNNITKNTLVENELAGIGLYGYKPPSTSIEFGYNNISSNIFHGCGLSVNAELRNLTSQYIDTSNKINGKSLYYCTNEVGLQSNDFLSPGQIILVNCSYSSISDFNLSYTTTGISIHYSKNNTISNITASDNKQYGIYLDKSQNITLSNNTANFNREAGICLSLATNNITLSNNIADNNAGYGIYITGTSHTISKNNMSNCGLGIWGELVDINTITIKDSNLVNDKKLYYYSNQINLNPADFSNPGQIILINCNYSVISNLIITNTSEAIHLFSCNHNRLLNITASNNTIYGISLRKCNNNTIFKSKLNKNEGDGLSLFLNSQFNNISTSTFSNNKDHGIQVLQSQNNTFYNNTISYNDGNGFSVEMSCDNTTISENKVYNNTDIGIYIYFSLFSKLLNNSVFNNSESGIIIESYPLGVVVTKSLIMNNTIISNGEYGIYSAYQLKDEIIGNKIKNNKEYGIYLKSTNNSIITDNSLIDNGGCINEEDCVGNTIAMNDCNGEFSPVIIDDEGNGDFTWAQAVEYSWCSGEGTAINPYIIKSITINGQNNKSCIEIRNSKVYFKVESCTFYNSARNLVYGYYAGILLNNTINGEFTTVIVLLIKDRDFI